MFCPGCGLRDENANQYCRACGTDLRPVRFALEKPDNITQSAVSAREEIGRAIAAKIRSTHNASELKIVAEEVLPEIEKFLESPAEKRLRRIRTGIVLSSIGAGTAIGISIASVLINEPELLVLAGFGIVAFFIGMGFILNGFFLTVPRKTLSDNSSDAERQMELDNSVNDTNELSFPESKSIFSSVTDHTTKHLKEK
jgi:hypothetical protein